MKKDLGLREELFAPLREPKRGFLESVMQDEIWLRVGDSLSPSLLDNLMETG